MAMKPFSTLTWQQDNVSAWVIIAKIDLNYKFHAANGEACARSREDETQGKDGQEWARTCDVELMMRVTFASLIRLSWLGAWFIVGKYLSQHSLSKHKFQEVKSESKKKALKNDTFHYNFADRKLVSKIAPKQTFSWGCLPPEAKPISKLELI